MKPVETATASVKLAQIVNLVKENQLVTALLLFVSWQMGLLAQASTVVAGVC